MSAEPTLPTVHVFRATFRGSIVIGDTDRDEVELIYEAIDAGQAELVDWEVEKCQP